MMSLKLGASNLIDFTVDLAALPGFYITWKLVVNNVHDNLADLDAVNDVVFCATCLFV